MTGLYEGFKKDNQIIKDFWEVVHEFSNEEKKRLMLFCFGSDRSPLKGLGALNMVILKHGDDSERLPSAHTCFNHLMLPHYSSKEKLRTKLLLAMDNCTGFGMI